MIDARAIISPKAQLAADVTVGPFSIIGPDVEIGAGTIVGPHVVINGPTVIGADNHIFQFASIGDAPQDKKYKGEPTRLEIGDRNVFRENCTVNRGTVHDKGVTRVGDDNLFMAYSHVGHDCQVGSKTVFANCAALETFGIHSVGLRGIAGDHDIRRDVALDDSAASEKGVRANLHELMDRGEAAQDHPVADLNMATERRAVREHRLAPNLTVMTNM